MSSILQVEGVACTAVTTNQRLASTEEQEQLIELKRLCHEDAESIRSGNPEAVSDFKFLRFLRGYKGVVTDAAAAYKRMVEWRIENKVEEAVAMLKASEKDGVIQYPYKMPLFRPLDALGGEDCLMQFNGTSDRDGNLITSVAVGNYDLRKIVKAGLQDLLVKSNIFLDCFFEIMLERLSIKNQKLMQRHDLLIVMNPSIGLFQFSPAALMLIKRVSLSSKHFPESIAKITSCGNNLVAVGIWKIIRPFVPRHTTEKITVLGTGFQEDLRTKIDDDALMGFQRYIK